MPKKWSEVSRATPEQQAEAKEFVRQEIERMGLPKLRQAQKLSQEEMAKRLKTNQSGVSRIEHQADMLIRSLRRFLQAVGGDLVLVARFPGGYEIELEGIGELTENGQSADTVEDSVVIAPATKMRQSDAPKVRTTRG